jgi:hypothetical protein
MPTKERSTGSFPTRFPPRGPMGEISIFAFERKSIKVYSRDYRFDGKVVINSGHSGPVSSVIAKRPITVFIIELFLRKKIGILTQHPIHSCMYVEK